MSAAGEARDFWRTKPSRGFGLLSTEEMDFCLTSWVLAAGFIGVDEIRMVLEKIFTLI